MKYRLLELDEVIKIGDEFNDTKDSLGWWKCSSSIDKTVRDFMRASSTIQVRRLVITTPKGNTL